MELFPFQITGVKQAVDWIWSGQDAIYLADEQGLGKSVQALAIIGGANQPVEKGLIICPAIMVLTWQKEITKYAGKDALKFFNIVSYDRASREIAYYKTYKYDFLILDEAHKLKNPKAKRTQNILSHIWPQCRYKICLSGTPATSSLLDLYTLFHLCSPKDFPNYWQFANTYLYKVENFFGVKYEGARNLDQLSALIRSKFFIRRLKADVLPELPDKVFKEVVLPEETALAPDTQTKKYLEGVIAGHVENYPDHFSDWRITQAACKLPAISDYVKELLEQDLPVILFCYHLDIAEGYKNTLSEFNPVLCTGETSASNKQAAVEDFQSGKTNLFIGTLGAAGLGITLTRSSDVILAEYSYVPAEIDQAIDRCHRIGQKNSVTVHYFVASGSEIEESITNILIKKINVLSGALNG